MGEGGRCGRFETAPRPLNLERGGSLPLTDSGSPMFSTAFAFTSSCRCGRPSRVIFQIWRRAWKISRRTPHSTMRRARS